MSSHAYRDQIGANTMRGLHDPIEVSTGVHSTGRAPWSTPLDLTSVLNMLTNTMPWADQAVCATTDPELFFPEKGQPILPARRICQGCPVREQCLEYALEENIPHGVWGGKSHTERKRERRSRGLTHRRNSGSEAA